MLTSSQTRVLSRLAEFGDHFDKAWDVPRELSLPGLAESLGVVRSALHAPLSHLESEGLISTRKAQVIGGGSRKRTVVNITAEGRRVISQQELSPARRKEGIIGPAPDPIVIHGRYSEIQEILELVKEGRSTIISGLPGIGKSTLARAVSSDLSNLGWTIRWANCSLGTDASSVGEMWLDKSSPSTIEAIVESIPLSKTLLVLDEAQELHPRHSKSISDLVSKASSRCPVLLVVRAPNPLEIEGKFSDLRLEGLEAEHAVKLLFEGTDPDTAEAVSDSLGGHPLAIRLWTPEEGVPEKTKAVLDYVKDTVISRLSEQGMKTLDELSIAPSPLGSEELNSEAGIAELDNSAVLKWSDGLMETHHLVRNVRKATLEQETLSRMHHNEAKKWSAKEGERARKIEAYHRSMSGQDDDVEWIEENIRLISIHDSSIAAVVIENALNLNDNQKLRSDAALLALDRGETRIAQIHIAKMNHSPSKKLFESRLARMDGKISDAQRLEEEAISLSDPSQRARIEVASVIRRFDDRLPGRMSKSESDGILNQISRIKLDEIPLEERESAILSLELVKYGIALNNSDLADASKSRAEIESRVSEEDIILDILDTKAAISKIVEGKLSEGAISSAEDLISRIGDYPSRISVIHATLEAVGTEIPDWLVIAHRESCTHNLREDIPSHRRLSAHRWYWRGILEPSNRISHWTEAISRFKAAECRNAANNLLAMLSKGI